MKKYIPLKANERGVTHLCIYVNYDLGKNEMYPKPRGYYLHVDPIKKERGFEYYGFYTGQKRLIKEVKRKSKGAELQAIRDAELIEKAMIGRVLASNHLELA